MRSLASVGMPALAKAVQVADGLTKMPGKASHRNPKYSSMPASYTRPGWNDDPLFTALPGLTCPAPKSKGSAGLTRSLSTTPWRAVVINAERAAAALQLGLTCLIKANRPATWGPDMEVPAIDWNSCP